MPGLPSVRIESDAVRLQRDAAHCLCHTAAVGRMVFADEVFYIHGPPTHLLSVHVANQKLLADRIFLAHAASLRQTSFFARWKFRGFLHSFDPSFR
jgi:hypothetical protein